MDFKINENGVVINPNVLIGVKDKNIQYSVKSATIEGQAYFESSVTISGFGIHSGSSGPVTKYSYTSLKEAKEYIKSFLFRQLKDKPKGLAYIKGFDIMQEQEQLTLF